MGPAYGDTSQYLRVFMAHLRRKLEPDPTRPRYFLTEPGLGIRFVPTTDADEARPRPDALPSNRP